MLHLLGSFSMVFQIPSSYSVVAIFKEESIKNFYFIVYLSFVIELTKISYYKS
jgi:hypothetical protein